MECKVVVAVVVDVELPHEAVGAVFVARQVERSRRTQYVAADDVGANVLVACTTAAADQYCYSGQEPFRQFRETTERIADAKAKLSDGQRTSNRIQRLYRKRSRRRDHAMNALLRDLVERLYDDGVETIYHGDLTGVLGEYWSVEANLKARTFWAHRQCTDQLANVCEEYSIEVASLSEAWTSQTCPERGEREQTRRHRETLRCPCGFEGHADLVASRTLLERATNTAVRPTARPCGSSGTTTSGPPSRGTRWFPTNSAQTRKVPPWCCCDTSERTLRERGVDVDPLVARFSSC